MTRYDAWQRKLRGESRDAGTTEKEKAIEALQGLPDDATIDDPIVRLSFTG